MAARRRSSLFRGRCAKCSKPFDKGAEIYYDKSLPKGSRTWHADCGAPAPTPAPLPQPEAPQPPQALPAGVQYLKTRSASGDVLQYVKADSLRALHDYRATVRNDANREHWQSVTPEERPNGPRELRSGALAWFGASGPETRRILDSGDWPEGVQRMLDTIGKIQSTAQPMDSRRRRRWTDQGDTVDMARVWAGRSEVAWQRCARTTTRAPAPVTIALNLAQSFVTPAEQLFWRGAAALLLADALTEAGYNVEIEAWNTVSDIQDGRSKPTDFAVGVTVKDARAPLDLNALAVSCAFGGFFRVEIFQAACALPLAVDAGLGAPQKFRDVVTEATDPRRPIICEGITNAESARKWIADALAAIEQPQQEAA